MEKISKDNMVKYLIKSYEQKYDKKISPIKLQKALYFMYAYYAGNMGVLNLGLSECDSEYKNVNLFDASFEAWPYGPVDREVYIQFKKGLINTDNFNVDAFLNDTDDYIRGYLEDMADRIFNSSDFGLVDLSHDDNCWKEHFDRMNPYASNSIPNSEIVHEYTEKKLN